jgi:hypothetical protein
VANVTPEILAKDFPSIKTDPATFEMFCRKWRYLFAYAEAGMGSGYVTCHMFTFIRPVCALYIWPIVKLTDAYCWHRMINRPNDGYRLHAGYTNLNGAMHDIHVTFSCWIGCQIGAQKRSSAYVFMACWIFHTCCTSRK